MSGFKLGSPGTPVSYIGESLDFNLGMFHRGTVSVSILKSKYSAVVGEQWGVYDTEGVRIMGGLLEKIKTVQAAKVADEVLMLEGATWEAGLERRKCKGKVYKNMTAGAIVKDLIDTYALGEQIFHTGGQADVQNGASAADIGTVTFLGKSVWQAIIELARISNYETWINPESYLQFKPRSAISVATLVVSTANKNYAAPSIDDTKDDYFNKVSIQIAESAFPAEQLSFTGDGSTQTFQVAGPLSSPPKLTVNGTLVTSIGVWGEDTGMDWYWVYGDDTIYQDPSLPALTGSDTLDVEYFYVGQNVIVVEDTADIAARAAAEGGSGIYEADMIVALDITTIEAGTAIADGFLDRHCPRRNGGVAGSVRRQYNFVFRSWEVNPTDIIPGSKITVNWTGNPSSGGSKQVIVHSVAGRHVDGSYIKKSDMTGPWDDGWFEYNVTCFDFVPPEGELDYFKALAERGLLGPEKYHMQFNIAETIEGSFNFGLTAGDKPHHQTAPMPGTISRITLYFPTGGKPTVNVSIDIKRRGISIFQGSPIVFPAGYPQTVTVSNLTTLGRKVNTGDVFSVEVLTTNPDAKDGVLKIIVN